MRHLVTARRAGRGTALLVAAAAAVGTLHAAPAAAYSTANGVRLNAVEARLVTLVNNARSANGVPALIVATGTTDVARRWSAYQASRSAMQHNPNLARDVAAAGSSSWTALAENVGAGRDADAVFSTYMNSSTHRANILSRSFRYLGIGWAERPDGTGYNTQVFVDAYSSSYGRTREPAYGGVKDTRAYAASGALADFESGTEPRGLTAVTGAGLAVSPLTVDPAGSGDQAGRFTVRQSAGGSGGGGELRLRDAVDLTQATALTVTLGAVTKTARPLTVVIAVRTAFGSTVHVGSVSVASGRTVSKTLPMPPAARSWRNEIVVHVSRAALTALDSASYAGRSATVAARDLRVVV